MDSKVAKMQMAVGEIIDARIKPLFKPGVKIAVIFSYEDNIKSSGMLTDMSDELLQATMTYLRTRGEAPLGVVLPEG